MDIFRLCSASEPHFLYPQLILNKCLISNIQFINANECTSKGFVENHTYLDPFVCIYYIPNLKIVSTYELFFTFNIHRLVTQCVFFCS